MRFAQKGRQASTKSHQCFAREGEHGGQGMRTVSAKTRGSLKRGKNFRSGKSCLIIPAERQK